MTEGWIKLFRSIKTHWIWDNSEYLKAWITILLTVNHEDKKVLIHGELITCLRGQSLLSLQNWANLFGKKWSIQRVRTFFDLLKSDSMITTEGLQKSTRLTVCNYECYQDLQQTNNKQITFKQQTDNTQVTTNKNEKNEKNEKEVLVDDFLSKIIKAFQDSYFEVFQNEYTIVSIGKERSAASKIAKIYKEKYPDAKTDEVISGLHSYFKKCCEVPDEWLQKNMSLPIIVSKFNEINNSIKNGKSKKIRSVASRSEEIDAIVDAVYDAKGLQ